MSRKCQIQRHHETRGWSSCMDAGEADTYYWMAKLEGRVHLWMTRLGSRFF